MCLAVRVPPLSLVLSLLQACVTQKRLLQGSHEPAMPGGAAQDTVSDLILIVAINAVLVFLLGAARALLYEIEPGRPQHLLWQSLYAVLVILFGQDFPDESAGVVEQACCTAFPWFTKPRDAECVVAAACMSSWICCMFSGHLLCLVPVVYMRVVRRGCSLASEGTRGSAMPHALGLVQADHGLIRDSVRCRPLRSLLRRCRLRGLRWCWR